MILPLRLEWEPCYCLDRGGLFGDTTDSEVLPGRRVRVKFSGRTYTGVVSETGVTPDVEADRILPVTSTDTGLPDITAEEIALWRFIAGYYLCTVGEVYKAAYPLQKLASEQVQARVRERSEIREVREEELWKGRISRLKDRLAAKDKALAGRHKAEVTQRLVLERAKIAGELYAAQARLAELDKDIFPDSCEDGYSLPDLPAPEAGLKAALAGRKPVLLEGTKRYGDYASLAAACLKKGRNVLLTVPEIALARQLQDSLRQRFGDTLLVHHSELSQVQRRRIADAVRSGRPYIVLGTRSAVFLPFRDLGLIIVDNEQSAFYKQSDSNPRYNARDCAVMLAGIHGAKVVLGSSSPSLESIFNCSTGKYKLWQKSSEGKAPMEVIDTAAERKKNGMIGPLSRKLVSACRAAKKVALIRGYEKEEDLRSRLEDLFPIDAEKFSILTIPQAGRTDFSAFTLVALTSADALFSRNDFRSDERAFQFLDSLRCSCGRVIVQTANSGNQVFRMSDPSVLLEERRLFNLPPYSRLVSVSRPGTGTVEHVTLARNLSIADRKKALQAFVQGLKSRNNYKGGVILDADPL